MTTLRRPDAPCSGCGGVRDRGVGQAFCRKCHAQDMRERRAAKKAATVKVGGTAAMRDACLLLERARTAIAMRTDVGGAVRIAIEDFLQRKDVAA